MKRLAPVLLVIAALAVAVFFYVRGETPYRPRAAEIAPAETLLLVQAPDLCRSARLFPQTALAHLLAEPEVRAFLAGPREGVPFFTREQLARLVRAAPREAFLAIAAWDGVAPKYVAGFAFSGSRRQAAALLAEPRAAMQKAWPAGRAGVFQRGNVRIDTFGEGGQVIAGAFLPGWYLVANDLATLEGAIDRCGGRAGGGLASTAAFQESTVALPAALDGFLFARSGLVQGQLGAWLATMSAAPAATATAPERTLAWGLQFDGALMRDTIFCPGPGTAAGRLPTATTALTSPDTLLYAAMALPSHDEFPAALSQALTLMSPTLTSLGSDLARKRITPEAFHAAFGPEASVLLTWPAEDDGPATTFALTVRDRAKARSFIEALTSPAASAALWRREEREGAVFYEAPMQPPAPVAPGIALTERFAVVGADAADVRRCVAQMHAGSAAIDRRPEMTALAGQMRPPTAACAYVDLRRLFERSYAMLRPFLAMSLAFSPSASQHFDASKLPSTDTIARHLGPTVYTQCTTARGALIESVGTLSFSQTLGSVMAAAWPSAAPMLTGAGRKAPAPAPGKPPAEISPVRVPAPGGR